MVMRREQWTRLDVPVQLDAPRKTFRFGQLFISPGGMFIPTPTALDPSTQVTVRFTVEGQAVVAHAEVRRVLDSTDAGARGIPAEESGLEMRIVRMEGDGSQILAEHIKKILLESGGPR